jgi:hypothetical protein
LAVVEQTIEKQRWVTRPVVKLHEKNLREGSGDYGKCGDGALLSGFDDYGVEVREDFFYGHGVDLALGVVALFDELLQIAAGDLRGELVGDDFFAALLLLDPGDAGQRDPHGAAVDVEADVDGVGVAGGDGHHGAFPADVQIFAGPAVGYVEIFVHMWLEYRCGLMGASELAGQRVSESASPVRL